MDNTTNRCPECGAVYNEPTVCTGDPENTNRNHSSEPAQTETGSFVEQGEPAHTVWVADDADATGPESPDNRPQPDQTATGDRPTSAPEDGLFGGGTEPPDTTNAAREAVAGEVVQLGQSFFIRNANGTFSGPYDTNDEATARAAERR